jgi:hypothetical protein
LAAGMWNATVVVVPNSTPLSLFCLLSRGQFFITSFANPQRKGVYQLKLIKKLLLQLLLIVYVHFSLFRNIFDQKGSWKPC